MYFNDPAIEAALEEGGWDGALRPGDSDFLYLVDSNVGFNKADSVIQRSLVYQVDLGDLNHPTGEVTLTYQHTGSGDLACKQVISYGNGTYLDMQQRVLSGLLASICARWFWTVDQHCPTCAS